MPINRASNVIQRLRSAALLHDQHALTDGLLLGRFIDGRDEGAFAALVQRHGPMVWGVCRRLLNHHDAEDAFQATFLVLVHKATCVVPRAMVGNWLFGVAYQTALQARRTAGRRSAREKQVMDMPDRAAMPDELWHDLRPLLDQELNRLPDAYRAVVVLWDWPLDKECDLATHLGWPEGTVAGRLARARSTLARRLARHGLTVSGAVLAAAFAQQAESACMPIGVVSSAIKAAGIWAAWPAAPSGTIPVKVAALTRGVLKTMMLSKLSKVLAAMAGGALVLALAACAPWTFAQTRDTSTANQQADTPPDKTPAESKAKWRDAFTLKHEHPVVIVACNADWIAAGDEDGNLFLCDATGKNRKLWVKGGKGQGLTSSIDHLKFTPDGKHLFVIQQERRAVCRFDLSTPDGKHPGVGGRNAGFLGFSADGATWLEGYGKALMLRPNVWTRTTADYEDIRYEAEAQSAMLSADDKWLAVLTADARLHIHDRASLRETQTIGLAKQRVTAMHFSPDGKRLAIVGDNGLARVYNTETGAETMSLKGHAGIVFTVAISPDGKKIATGGDDNLVRVWDADTGKLLARLAGHKDSVRSVAFHPAGDRIITGSADHTVRIWESVGRTEPQRHRDTEKTEQETREDQDL
jgi:RNA polymerase sigma factor (sigma-70 family)